MERDVKEIIRRNKDALGQPYDEESINLFEEVNKRVTLQTILEIPCGYILADGLIVGYEI